jgi:hypothetical protein
VLSLSAQVIREDETSDRSDNDDVVLLLLEGTSRKRILGRIIRPSKRLRELE